MQNAEAQTVPLSEYQKLEADYQQVESEVSDLKQRLAWFERMLFGRKSERHEVVDEQAMAQLKLSFESEAQQQVVEESVRQMIAAHERKVPVKEDSAHKGRIVIPPHLPRVEEVIEPDEDISDMTRIGQDVTEVLEVDPGRLWVRRIVRPRYARRQSTADEAEQGPIVQAPAKELPFGRSKAGVSLIVNILISKYVEHLPLHRLIA
jgi:transposase